VDLDSLDQFLYGYFWEQPERSGMSRLSSFLVAFNYRFKPTNHNDPFGGVGRDPFEIRIHQELLTDLANHYSADFREEGIACDVELLRKDILDRLELGVQEIKRGESPLWLVGIEQDNSALGMLLLSDSIHRFPALCGQLNRVKDGLELLQNKPQEIESKDSDYEVGEDKIEDWKSGQKSSYTPPPNLFVGSGSSCNWGQTPDRSEELLEIAQEYSAGFVKLINESAPLKLAVNKLEGVRHFLEDRLLKEKKYDNAYFVLTPELNYHVLNLIGFYKGSKDEYLETIYFDKGKYKSDQISVNGQSECKVDSEARNQKISISESVYDHSMFVSIVQVHASHYIHANIGCTGYQNPEPKHLDWKGFRRKIQKLIADNPGDLKCKELLEQDFARALNHTIIGIGKFPHTGDLAHAVMSFTKAFLAEKDSSDGKSVKQSETVVFPKERLPELLVRFRAGNPMNYQNFIF
jgi:hypothetical protein